MAVARSRSVYRMVATVGWLPPTAPGTRSTTNATPSLTRSKSTPALSAAACTNRSAAKAFCAVAGVVNGVETGTPVRAVVTRPM